MNNIVLPMKVHAVKLEYRRQLMEKMPHGYFRVIRGKTNVVITHDPDNPRYIPAHPRTLYVSSKKGKAFADAINDYLRIKSEYDALLESWRARYSMPPPGVKFPVQQFFDPHRMDNEYFRNQPGCLGKYHPDNPTVSDHGELKSKNEQMGADLLKLLGIPFKYETEIYLPAIDQSINPDYLVCFYEIDRCAYLEILGMNDKIEYSLRTATRITGFSLEKYRPGREVIYVHIYDKNNFDEDYFVSQVLSAFNDMIPDDALEWETQAKAV
ncbi:MAG: hypothetical protein IKG01_01335 [Lachnospiraceae bacterium]|nr:hypothetical protein [Lachnospiraceae bacterium]